MTEQINIAKVERGVCVMAGTLLIWHGLRRRSWAGAGLAFLGAGLMRRGIAGCSSCEPGIAVDEAVTVNRPIGEVYGFWRNTENLAELMEHVESVRPIDATHSHWVAKGPTGTRVEWDAEITQDIENRLIEWRSLDGADVPNEGSVRFTEAANGRGTEVRVEMRYGPPVGSLAAFVAKLCGEAFGEAPFRQVRNDLKRIKNRLETGVVPTTSGQPVGGLQTETEGVHEKVVSASEESFPASDAPAFTH